MPNLSQSHRTSRGTTAGNRSGLIAAGLSGSTAGLSGIRTRNIAYGGNRSAALGFFASALVIVALSVGVVNNASAQEPKTDTQAASAEVSDKQQRQVILIADGETRTVQTDATTVAELLKSQNIGLLQQDRCSIAPKTPLTDGMTVRVTRIRTATEFVHDPIAPPVKRTPSTTLKPGVTKVATEGTEGIWTRKFVTIRKDNAVVSRKMVAESRIAPQPKIILFGSRSTNSLASRGILSRGLRVLDMVATGYGPGENGKWGDVTCTGRRMGRGVVAVDPRVIRLGTRLHIEGYGVCVAGDVGGAIKGNRVDLGFDSRSEAAAVGRRRVRVTILN